MTICKLTHKQFEAIVPHFTPILPSYLAYVTIKPHHSTIFLARIGWDRRMTFIGSVPGAFKKRDIIQIQIRSSTLL